MHFNKRVRNWQTSTHTALAVVLRFIAFRKWRHYFLNFVAPVPITVSAMQISTLAFGSKSAAKFIYPPVGVNFTTLDNTFNNT